MWMVLLSALSWADTGDEEYCETSRAGGVLQDGMCVFDRIVDFCPTGCNTAQDYLDAYGWEDEIWQCAAGSSLSYIINIPPSDADAGQMVWFGPDGVTPVALMGGERVCCENVIVYYVVAGYTDSDALGTCYAPVYAQRERLLDPTSQTCEPTPEGKGCATAPSAPLWSGLLALLLLRVRR